MNFESFGFDPRILKGVTSAGYITPTPIQLEAMPHVLAGRDVVGLAQTGTGKTAAFVLPILQRLIRSPQRKIQALVLSPTRELAEQTRGEIASLGLKTRLRSMAIYGGVGMKPQLDRLHSGVDIVVACPGRLLDHMGQGKVDLSTVKVLVLDEADRMLDMGFEPDIRRIVKRVPRQRQTLLFSATMPEDILRLAREFMQDPVSVSLNHSRPVETVSHYVYPVEGHLKTRLLIELLRSEETDSVLVFTRSRMRTNRLAGQLKRAGFSVASLEGGMPQKKRQAALQGFRDRKYQILVATDIAARGMDVLSISHVVNYDVPDTADTYTHRIGRTGRAEQTGRALTLVTQDEATAIRDFERDMAVEMPCCEVEGFEYDAPMPPRPRSAPRRNGQRPGRRKPARQAQHR
ncbi:MAG: DEAD/DEAH box helicase [Nitrospirota bacterium]|jgi:ATP-dependent RNA helicase RhlE